MTFLNPIALFGLIAAAIPILLHIFNLRKLNTIEFSTLTFLKELQKTKIRRLKIRQLLLLFLRTLLVILIVVAFSRPTLKGSIPGGLAQQARTTAVILIDDSQSMTARDEQGELLHQAKNIAATIINLLKDGDEVFLIKLSDITVNGSTEIPSAQRNFPAVRSAINDIKPSFLHRTIEDGLRFSTRLLSSSKNFNKEVYIISDFQSGSLESKLNVSKTAEQLFPTATQFFLIPLGKHELQNIAVESINILNTIFEVSKPFILRAKLINHGTADVQNHVVSLYQDGSRVAQKGIDIRAGQSAEMEFMLVPKQPGFLEGTIELEDDDLEFDNRRYFSVYIPKELRVLLVGNKSDLTYIRLAVATRISDSSTNLIMTETQWERFSASQLNNTDIAVLSNPNEVTGNQASALKTYVQDGGGILIFPGMQTNVNAFNTGIAAVLGIPAIGAIENQSGMSQSKNSFLEFDKVDWRHPLFAGMFEGDEEKRLAGTTHRQRELESPRVKISLRFLPTPHSKIIISLTNGSSFLLEEHVKNGRILLVSVGADTKWSDLPLKGLFVPLIHRSIAYLAQDRTDERSLIISEERMFRLSSSIPPRLTVLKPAGKETFINLQQLSMHKSVRFSDADIPGIYTVTSGSQVLDRFAVNIDPDESNTITSSRKQQEKLFEKIGILNNAIHTMNQPQEAQRIITESRFGTELWKQFLIIALMIAIIEMLVAKDTKRAQASTVIHTTKE